MPYIQRTRAQRATQLLWLATLAWAAHRALFPLAETDLFFHLKLGDLIVATRHIPFRNLFSFTYPDHPDPDLAWAFQVAVSLAYRAGGFAAIVVGKTLLVVAATALLWGACRRRGAAALPTALALVMAIETARPRLVERPHLVTFVGLGAIALLLSGIESRARWWWFPVLTLVWAQFHAGVFFCPLLLAGFVVGAAVDGVALPWRNVALALGLTVAATFATPAGTMLPRYLLWHTGLGATRAIDEFRRADAWNDPWFFALLASALAAAVARGRRELRHILPVVLAAALALRSVRFVAEWAFVAAPLVADGLARLIAAHAPRLGRPRAAGVVALALVAIIAADRAVDRSPPRLAVDVVPFDAIDFVTTTGLRRRMFHDLDVGCYLAWQGWPRWQVFEDARLPAYPDEFHRALDDTPLAPAAFDALLRRYQVDAALVGDPGINRRAGSFAPDEWALVWRRPSALVFARRTPEHAAVIAAHEIPLAVEFRWVDGTHVVPLTLPPLRSPVSRCEWDRRLAVTMWGEADPERALDARVDALAHGCLDAADEADTRFHLGARLQQGGELGRAAAEYDRVLQLAPDHVGALVNRGWARLRSDPSAARNDLEHARQLAPERAAEIEQALAQTGVNHKQQLR
jgi:tetratricopeptide (TPR) repeat protein